MPRQNISVQIFTLSDDATFKEIVDGSLAAMAKVPPEYRDTIQMDWHMSDYSATAYVCYYRPETDAEMAARESEERQRQEKREREERMTFERLKQKFEG